MKKAFLIVKNNMLIWNSNDDLDRASVSNFKAPGLKIDKGNCSKLYFISDDINLIRYGCIPLACVPLRSCLKRWCRYKKILSDPRTSMFFGRGSFAKYTGKWKELKTD